ncbi:hypothetical protein PR202_gb17705 [Eleusine coracana subsp. coracana]|uniref:FAD dependent oxidoreductase domain-containing protein n=1 Tax=Eleusine coracana subsp. coracana TaxID=191504 RepID=A0AAV5F3M6_ELECO|nr:hypothetical protein PR202_gb17705 [Eleusine coracana subsp. coracana]
MPPPPPCPSPPTPVLPNLNLYSRRTVAAAAAASSSLTGGHGRRPLRYAVLGAGFAGLSVRVAPPQGTLLSSPCPLLSCDKKHRLKRRSCSFQHSPRDSRVSVDLYDENGVGGGASGVSGGLLHPYSPKGRFSLIRGILRPPTNEKAADILLENAQSSLQSCSLQVLDSDAAQGLIPGLCVPFDYAVYMPLALNINPKKYLQALFLACQNLSDEASVSPSEQKEFKLYNQRVDNLQQLAGDYDSVIICLGAKAGSLPGLTNKLPLRACRGVIAEFQLPSDSVEEYGNQSPSILSDAWMAFQGPRSVSIGSTWQWNSENYASMVSDEEARAAMEELVPKASGVYPGITKWDFVCARAGIRAMPPLTANGSLPLLGCLNDVIGDKIKNNCTFWLVGGLGARGLLYHGLVGKLTAQAAISCDESLIPSEFTCWKVNKASQ